MKEIFIYNKSKIEKHLVNLIIPLIVESTKLDYKIHVLSGSSNDMLKQYLKHSKNIQINVCKKNTFLHILQLIHFVKQSQRKKLVVLTENQAILVGIISKLFFAKECIVLYKQGALTAEKIYLKSGKLRKLKYSLIEQLSLKFSDEAIFVSNKMADYYKKEFNYKKTFNIINNKVLLTSKPQNKAERNTVEIVYAGSIAKWQKADYIVQLFAELSKQTNISFKIISNSKHFFEKKNIKKLTVSESTPEQIINKLSLSDIGIIIRDDNVLNYVSSPIKIGEYLSAGLPIIATNNIGDYSDVIQKNELGVIITGKNIKEDAIRISKYVAFYLTNKTTIQQSAFEISQKLFLDYSLYKPLFDEDTQNIRK